MAREFDTGGRVLEDLSVGWEFEMEQTVTAVGCRKGREPERRRDVAGLVVSLQRAAGNRATTRVIKAVGAGRAVRQLQRDPPWSQRVSPPEAAAASQRERAVSGGVPLLGTTPIFGQRSWTAGPAQRETIVHEGIPAMLADPGIAYYALMDAQHLAARNVHAHLGNPRLSPEHSVEVGSARVGPGNALRHCTWSAAVGFYALAHSAEPDPAGRLDVARRVLLAHEPRVGSAARPIDSRVDMFNNEVGLTIAYTVSQAPHPSVESLLAACRDALDFGRLQMLDPDGTRRIISTDGWRQFGPDAWHGLTFEGVRQGVTAQQAQSRGQDRARQAGEVGHLANVLVQIRRQHTGQVMAMTGALAIINRLSDTERTAARGHPAVVALLADPAVPITIRSQLSSALAQAAAGDAAQVPLH